MKKVESEQMARLTTIKPICNNCIHRPVCSLYRLIRLSDLKYTYFEGSEIDRLAEICTQYEENS